MIKKIFEILISLFKTNKKVNTQSSAVKIEGPVISANPVKKIISEPAFEFIKGQPLFADNLIVKKLREIIGDEFKLGNSGDCLNCTEYVHFRVKQKLGIDIRWPSDRPRNGGKWAEIFKRNNLYNIFDAPKVNCAVSLTTGISANPEINEIGHVAFVEKVNEDNSIEISEANWPNQGKYNERRLEKWQWQDKYKCKFIDFI